MRFLVAEDHELVSSTVLQLVKHCFAGAETEWVKTADALLQRFRASAWDILLLDVELADTSSLELIPELKQLRPKCRILVYTGHPEKVFGMQAIKAGADGFIHKTSPASEFLKAIQALVQGQRYISGQVAEGLMEAFQRSDRLENDVRLSAREFQVMRSIAAGKYNGEIAAELGISEKSVSTYRSRILVKLGLRNNADLVKHAVRMGYVK